MNQTKNFVFNPMYSEEVNILLNIDEPEKVGKLFARLTVDKFKAEYIKNKAK